MDAGHSQRLAVLRVIGLAVLPLLLLAGWVLWQDAREGERQVVLDRVALVQSGVLFTDALVSSSLSTVRAVALAPIVKNPSDSARIAEFLTQVASQNPEWDGLGLVGPDGWNLAGTFAPPRTTNIADRPYFRQVVETGRTAVSELIVGRARNTPSVILAAPVAFADGQRGALIVPLSTARVADALRAQLGANGASVILLDAEGRPIVHPDPAQVGRLESLRGRADVDAVLRGETGSQEIRVDGVEVLVVYAPVPAYGWAVLLVEPTAQAFGAVRQDLAEKLGLLAIVLAGVGVLGWYLGGRLSASYRRAAEAREQAEAARAEAEAAVEARDQFLSIASHELRTPVTTIKGAAQLLLRSQSRGRLRTEQLEQLLARIDLTSDRLGVLVSDLLDVSRLQSGQMPLRPAPLDLATFVRGVAERFGEHIGERHQVVVETSDGTCRVEADAGRLEQVVWNLLDNAAKYSPDGGEIRVRVEQEGTGAMVSVQDRGIGLPSGAETALFEPFGRASNALDRQLPGLGLGLYICRMIVEGHGGKIRAMSDGDGKGTTFAVWLPGRSA